jgi:hypothetical protein
MEPEWSGDSEPTLTPYVTFARRCLNVCRMRAACRPVGGWVGVLSYRNHEPARRAQYSRFPRPSAWLPRYREETEVGDRAPPLSVEPISRHRQSKLRGITSVISTPITVLASNLGHLGQKATASKQLRGLLPLRTFNQSLRGCVQSNPK